MPIFGPRTYYIFSTSFLGYKSSKKDENMMSYTIFYVESTEALMGKARRRGVLNHIT